MENNYRDEYGTNDHSIYYYDFHELDEYNNDHSFYESAHNIDSEYDSNNNYEYIEPEDTDYDSGNDSDPENYIKSLYESDVDLVLDDLDLVTDDSDSEVELDEGIQEDLNDNE